MKNFFAALSVCGLMSATPVVAQQVLLEDGRMELVPSAQILKRALSKGGAELDEIDAYYASRAYLPVWSRDDARRDVLLAALSSSDAQGLPEEAYEVDQLTALQQDLHSLEGRARLEVAFAKVFVDYARDVNSGVLNPRDVNSEIQHQPNIKPVRELFLGLVRADDARSYLKGLAPQTREYAALMDEKRRLKLLIESENMVSRISARGIMRPGYTGARVTLVRERLSVLGYGDLGESPVYDEDLVAVVKRFQTDHKLTADSVMGPATIGAMNKSSSDRLAQVLVNLERQRWMNYDRSGRHINVNIADFMMAVVDDGTVTFESKVVVGKTGRDFRTPEFSKDMTHLIVNPYWHVPRSIAGREYLPMLKRDPLALSRRGLLLLNRKGQVLNTAGADFSRYSERNFPFFIKQPPGATNALGQVKFMFPNRNNIYLHDTPAKKLFARDRRAYSHGCIRVAQPFELAYHLLGEQSANPQGLFNGLLNRQRERQVNFDTAVPVHLTYNTAFMAADGTIAYREDIYHRDNAVFGALLDSGVHVEGLSG